MVRVGKIKSAHGIKGDLYLILFADHDLDLAEAKSLSLQSPDGQVEEIEVRSLRAHKKGFVVQSNTVKDRNHAEALEGFFLMAEKEEVIEPEFMGFQIKDGESDIGRIVRTVSSGLQELVETDKGHLVPLVDEFIVSSNAEEKVLQMSLPEGLIEVQSDQD